MQSLLLLLWIKPVLANGQILYCKAKTDGSCNCLLQILLEFGHCFMKKSSGHIFFRKGLFISRNVVHACNLFFFSRQKFFCLVYCESNVGIFNNGLRKIGLTLFEYCFSF